MAMIATSCGFALLSYAAGVYVLVPALGLVAIGYGVRGETWGIPSSLSAAARPTAALASMERPLRGASTGAQNKTALPHLHIAPSVPPVPPGAKPAPHQD